jgi:hypothetical protein
MVIRALERRAVGGVPKRGNTGAYRRRRIRLIRRTLSVFFAKVRVRIPRGPGAGGTPVTNPDSLQMPLGVLGGGEGLFQPCLGPHGQHQPFIGHL